MIEIKVNVGSDEAPLSATYIGAKLEEQRAAIPSDIDAMVDEFLKITNVTVAKRLLMIVDAFPNPEEGFRIWKAYYRDGNDSALRKELLKHKFPSSLVIGLIRDVLKDRERLGETKPGIARSAANAAHMLFIRATLAVTARRINHTDRDTEIAIESMMAARRLVYDPNKDVSPLNDALHEPLKAALESKMTVSLADLRKAAAGSLLAESAVRTARDAALKKRVALFDALAAESFADAAGRREVAALSCHQIPEGQKFGIECEGFLPSDEPLIKQVMKLYSFLGKSEYKKLGLGVRFPLMSLMPKNDDKYEKWAITMDSSVINPLRFVVRRGKSRGLEKVNNVGLEIVSAVLDGPMGGLQAMVVVQTLRAMGLRTNQTCGFHVHVDVSDASLDELKNLAKAYVRNEARFDAFVDPQRRGAGSVFAKSVVGTELDAIDDAEDKSELIEVMNKGDRNSKFDITNLGSPGAPPTVQYRGEGGAGYLDGAMDYAVLLVNFTRMARTDPGVTVDQVLAKLRSELEPKPEQAEVLQQNPVLAAAAAS